MKVWVSVFIPLQPSVFVGRVVSMVPIREAFKLLIPKGPRTQTMGFEGPNTINRRIYLGPKALLFGSSDP